MNLKKQKFIYSILMAGALVVCAALSGVMLPLLIEERGFSLMCIPITVIFAFGAFLLLWGSHRSKDEPMDPVWLAGLLAALGLTLFARVALFPCESDDFLAFLSAWLEQIREMPGFTSLGENIGNYNVPYFYILFGIGKLLPPSADLYAIKLVSVLFDYVLAYFIMKIAMLKTEKRSVATAAFLVTLLVPSILLNGGMWGQCDGIYAAFAIGGLYYGMRGKSRLCWAFFAIALAVKLQTVFLLPMLIVFLFTERVRLKDIWIFPALFLLLLVPAMLAGRGFIDCISIYFKQATTYSELSMLAPSLYAWFPGGTRSNIPVTAAGILVAGAVALSFLLYLYRRRKQLDDTALVESAFLFALTIPFFLPLMHERYFYLADAMAAVYFFWRPRRWYISALVLLSSFFCYICFLFDSEVVPLWLLAFFMLGAICLVLKDFAPRVDARRGIRSL